MHESRGFVEEIGGLVSDAYITHPAGSIGALLAFAAAPSGALAAVLRRVRSQAFDFACRVQLLWTAFGSRCR